MKYEEYAAIVEKERPEPYTPEWEAYWQRCMELSQQVTTYEFEPDGELARIPYGKEGRYEQWAEKYGDPPPTDPCHDCAVKIGQLHVPGCDVGECPSCHGQAISCDCISEDEETE